MMAKSERTDVHRDRMLPAAGVGLSWSLTHTALCTPVRSQGSMHGKTT